MNHVADVNKMVEDITGAMMIDCNTWHNCRQEMPVEHQECIVMDIDGYLLHARYQGGQWMFYDEYDHESVYVLMWIPFPAMYRINNDVE